MRAHSFLYSWLKPWVQGIIYRVCKRLLIEMQVPNSRECFYYNHVAYPIVWLF